MARGGSRVEKLQGERVVCPVVNGRVYRRLPTIELKNGHVSIGSRCTGSVFKLVSGEETSRRFTIETAGAAFVRRFIEYAIKRAL